MNAYTDNFRQSEQRPLKQLRYKDIVIQILYNANWCHSLITRKFVKLKVF